MSLFTPESRSGWPPSAAQSEYKSCGPLVDRADLTTCRGGFDLVVDLALFIELDDSWLTCARFGRW